MFACTYCNDKVPKNTYCLLHWYPDPYCSRRCFTASGNNNGGVTEGSCIMEWNYCLDATRCPNYQYQLPSTFKQE